ncbi:MAG: hypothetical protein KTR31_01000 [Myxococcales bacterium]|nr:hypothetical protein [Myxococcales bacterium]
MPWLFIVLALVGIASWWLMAPDPPRPEQIRISPSDPLLEQARIRTRDTLGLLREHLTHRRSQVLVKFRVAGLDHEYRGQWGQVLAFDDNALTVRPSGSHASRTLTWEQVEDWQLTLPDGNVRGAFTVVAIWRIRERDAGRLPPGIERQLPRFLDAE